MAGTYHPDGGTTLPCDARIAGEGAGAWGGRSDTPVSQTPVGMSVRPPCRCERNPITKKSIVIGFGFYHLPPQGLNR